MDAAQLLPTELILNDFDRWFVEDGLDEGDITSEVLFGVSEQVDMRLVAREPMIVCGLEPVARGVEGMNLGVSVRASVDDGQQVSSGEVLAEVSGNRRPILASERALLNLLGRLAGVATCTRQYVEAVAGTGAVITDTRKTMPGLRVWDKYAVLCGGGTSHRMGLDDAALFKDNHFAGLPPEDFVRVLSDAVARARADRDLSFVEVEVDTLEQFDLVLKVPGVDIVLLDNMPPDMMQEAVRIRNDRAAGVLLEASGGITLKTVRAAAESGVDRIAIGALTRDATMLDIGLDA